MRNLTFYAIAGLAICAAAAVVKAAAVMGVSDVAAPGALFAMALQTAYNATQEAGAAGMVVNMRTYDAITRSAETAAGISFGVAVGQGTDRARGCVLGGTLDLFLGVSIRDVTLVSSQSDKYARYQNVGILTNGEIWVQTSVSVDPDEPVHYDSTTGIFATSGGIGPILGARWMEANDGAGIARLFLPAYRPAT